MKKKRNWLVPLIIILCIAFVGSYILGFIAPPGTAFDDMVYTRPDLQAMDDSLNQCIQLAEEGSDFDELWNQINSFFTQYSSFSTQYLLSYVHYCLDMQDSYWVTEYNFCEQSTAQVDAARDQLLHALAKSSFREQLEGEDYFGADYFDDYDGESIWTDEFKALNEQEAELVNKYYQILQEGNDVTAYSEEYYDTYGLQLEELFAELVALRLEIAQQAGYSTYSDYAYETIYTRDYSVDDANKLCQDISQQLVPLYLELAETGFWYQSLDAVSERETLSYVRTAANNMGGEIKSAFRLMEDNNLYHISYGENKLDGAFEVYFYDYYQPFVFMSPVGNEMDYLSFAHEFGHFCNDYASYGSVAGIDINEVFSQGMEFLSLTYSKPSQELVDHKLGDSVSTYVEQAAYSWFEQEVYALSTENITAQNIRELFAETCEMFGLDYWGMDPRGYVDVTHFFTQPLYVISYVVSNDAAFQLYQREQQETGAGLAIYLEALDTEQDAFLLFLEENGLESPFQDGHIQSVRKTLEKEL